MRPIPYTTSPGTDGTGNGRAGGNGRPAASLGRCRTPGVPDEGITGARRCAVTAASPANRRAGPAAGVGAAAGRPAGEERRWALGVARQCERPGRDLTAAAGGLSPGGESFRVFKQCLI
jgi:hypothetical protein